jgi:hypothetical protein
MQSYLIMEDGAAHTVGENWIPIECFRCGICCQRYRPKVKPEEIVRISRELGMTPAEFSRRYVRSQAKDKNRILLQDAGDHCPFLSQDKDTMKASCKIHKIRPRLVVTGLPAYHARNVATGLAVWEMKFY